MGQVSPAPTQDVAVHLEIFALTRSRELAQGTTQDGATLIYTHQRDEVGKWDEYTWWPIFQ